MTDPGKYVKNTRYYRGTVYEWNLPTGTTCPFALECKVTVNRETGKFSQHSGEYKCYASTSERFPGVRERRWLNFEAAKRGEIPPLPKDCTALRIHMSGDFFNQAYFDRWLEIAAQHPHVEMWAYTKSIQYWVKRLGSIPPNLLLTASYGGRDDALIEQHDLKNVRIYSRFEDVPANRPLDLNDDCARVPGLNFAFLDNHKVNRKTGYSAAPAPLFDIPIL